jgi:hypothetical protein
VRHPRSHRAFRKRLTDSFRLTYCHNVMIHEAATGGMRDVDRLATAAMREAARKKRRLVERDAVARVIAAHTHSDTAAAMAIT